MFQTFYEKSHKQKTLKFHFDQGKVDFEFSLNDFRIQAECEGVHLALLSLFDGRQIIALSKLCKTLNAEESFIEQKMGFWVENDIIFKKVERSVVY